MSWKERKIERIEHYLNNIYGWKLRNCSACNGSGYYDSCDKKGRPIRCGSCEGTGKERYKTE